MIKRSVVAFSFLAALLAATSQSFAETVLVDNIQNPKITLRNADVVLTSRIEAFGYTLIAGGHVVNATSNQIIYLKRISIAISNSLPMGGADPASYASFHLNGYRNLNEALGNSEVGTLFSSQYTIPYTPPIGIATMYGNDIRIKTFALPSTVVIRPGQSLFLAWYFDIPPAQSEVYTVLSHVDPFGREFVFGPDVPGGLFQLTSATGSLGITISADVKTIYAVPTDATMADVLTVSACGSHDC